MSIHFLKLVFVVISVVALSVLPSCSKRTDSNHSEFEIEPLTLNSYDYSVWHIFATPDKDSYSDDGSLCGHAEGEVIMDEGDIEGQALLEWGYRTIFQGRINQAGDLVIDATEDEALVTFQGGHFNENTGSGRYRFVDSCTGTWKAVHEENDWRFFE